MNHVLFKEHLIQMFKRGDKIDLLPRNPNLGKRNETSNLRQMDISNCNLLSDGTMEHNYYCPIPPIILKQRLSSNKKKTASKKPIHFPLNRLPDDLIYLVMSFMDPNSRLAILRWRYHHSKMEQILEEIMDPKITFKLASTAFLVLKLSRNKIDSPIYLSYKDYDKYPEATKMYRSRLIMQAFTKYTKIYKLDISQKTVAICEKQVFKMYLMAILAKKREK